MTNSQTARQKQTVECNRLVKEKKDLESKIQDFESILRSNDVGMKTALVDAEGYPRGDIDIYAIKHARAALAPLYNDLKSKTLEIEQSLIALHSIPVDPTDQPQILEIKPFAKVNGVAPDSPAGTSGLQRGDLILMFGEIDCLQSSPLEKIAAALPNLEFVSCSSDLEICKGKDPTWLYKAHTRLGTKALGRKRAARVSLDSFVKKILEENNKMFFGFEIEAPEEGKDSTKTAAPPTTWNVWDSLKEAGQIVARDLSDLGQLNFKEEEDSNEPAGAIESALDTLDESLGKAEKLAIKGISDIGSGLASGFSKLFVQKTDNTPTKSSLSERATKEIIDAGIDSNTFIDPLESKDTLLIERFMKFKEDFDRIAYAGRISRKYDEQPAMIKFMKTIVPEKVSDEDFWLRYYFKISELNLAQEQRLLLLKTDLQNEVEEDVAWSSDEEDAPVVKEEVNKEVLKVVKEASNEKDVFEERNNAVKYELQNQAEEDVAWSSDEEDAPVVKEEVKKIIKKEVSEVAEKTSNEKVDIVSEEVNKNKKSAKSNSTDIETKADIVKERKANDSADLKESSNENITPPVIEKSVSSNSLAIAPAQSESVSSGGFEIVEQKDEDWGGWD